VSGNIKLCGYSWGSLDRGRKTTVGLSTAGIFSVFASCVFGNLRPALLSVYSDTDIAKQLVILKHLEWLFHVKLFLRPVV